MTDPRVVSVSLPARGQRLVAALVVALALVTGLVLGVAVDRRVLLHRSGAFGGRAEFGVHEGPRRGGPPPERMRQRFAADLGLTSAQMAQVDSIMSRQMAERRTLEDTMGARIRVLMDSTRAAVDRVLTPEQRQKFAALRAHRDSARGAGRGRGFGGDRP
jgi:Spy/CpxP family protein refolding chaperone